MHTLSRVHVRPVLVLLLTISAHASRNPPQPGAFLHARHVDGSTLAVQGGEYTQANPAANVRVLRRA